MLYFFDQLTYLRIILFIFRFLTENFVFIFNYLGSDIFLLVDRTLALDLLHGSVIQHLKKLRVQTQAASQRVSRAAIQEVDMAASRTAVLNLQRVSRNLKVNQQVPNLSQSFQKPKRSQPLRRNG